MVCLIKDEYEVPSERFLDENGKFSGAVFLKYLQIEAFKVPYDNAVPKKGQLPPYYDEQKFKRAQAVYREYRSNILLVKLAGLITLLFDHVANKIILLTNRSSTPETACIRYHDTVKLVTAWYGSDFKENSALWKSIYRVRAMHHAANLLANKHPGVQLITQRELSVTVIGFIGYAIVKPEYFGLSSMTDEDCEALVHLWRVIGYLLGVDDRFNICRVSLAETRSIFAEILYKFEGIAVLKDPDCLRLQFAAIEGLALLGLFARPEWFLNFTYDLLVGDRKAPANLYFPLNLADKFSLLLFKLALWLLQFRWLRRYANKFTVKMLRSKSKDLH